MLLKQVFNKDKICLYFSDNPNGLSALLRDEDAHALPRTHAFGYGKTPLGVHEKENNYENLQSGCAT